MLLRIMRFIQRSTPEPNEERDRTDAQTEPRPPGQAKQPGQPEDRASTMATFSPEKVYGLGGQPVVMTGA